MEVAPRLSVVAQRARQQSHPVAVRGERAALAVGAEVLGGIEAEGGGPAEAADAPAVVARAVGLAGILDDGDVVASGDRQDGIEIRGPAVEVHRHDCPRARGDRGFDALGVEVGGSGTDVHEHRPGADVGDGFGGGDEGVGRGDDLVARLHPHRQQGQMQGARARVHGHAVLDATVCSELLLEARDLLAENERRRSADAVQRGQNVLSEAVVLRLQVEVRNFHGQCFQPKSIFAGAVKRIGSPSVRCGLPGVGRAKHKKRIASGVPGTKFPDMTPGEDRWAAARNAAGDEALPRAGGRCASLSGVYRAEDVAARTIVAREAGRAPESAAARSATKPLACFSSAYDSRAEETSFPRASNSARLKATVAYCACVRSFSIPIATWWSFPRGSRLRIASASSSLVTIR